MSFLMQKLLGRLYMNEAPADGGDGGGGLPANAPAAVTDAPAQAPAAVPAAEAPSLLGDLAKPETEAAPDKPADDAAKPDAPVLPEVYELKMPEGVELDEAAAPLVQKFFKKHGVTQENAQSMLDDMLEIDQARQLSPEQIEQQQVEAIGALNKSWADECAKLPDIGGENFNKSLETTSKVMVKFGTPVFREMLNRTALGSNPEFFKFIHSIGSAMSQDTLEHGGNAANGPRSIEERLWPKK